MSNISVIIPAFNAEKFLEEAVESVLKQSLLPDEIIIVDDGSTDHTSSIIRKFPSVKYVYQANQGTANAINTGIVASRCKFLAFLDADDLWMPDKLKRQIEFTKENPSIELIFTWLQNFIDESIDTTLHNKIEFNPLPMIGIHKSTLFLEKETFLKIGLLTPYSSVDLLDWYARAKEIKIKEHIIPEVLVKRRIHGDNQSLTNSVIKNEFPKILKKILDRRRLLK